MAKQPDFGLFLIGVSGRPRPPFFFAYAVWWAHLCLAGAALLTAGGPLAAAPALVAVASLCAGLAVYGLLTRRWEYLPCLPAYAFCLDALYAASPSPRLWLGCALVALGSLYLLISTEYRRYRPDAPLPAWIPPTAGAIVVAVFLFALFL